jgi:putative restriction endonuclease
MYAVEVRRDILEEKDGPTLLHALQGVHRTTMVLPSRIVQRPDAALLEQRYERFRQAG